MSLFEFDKILVRKREVEDYIETEFLFFQEHAIFIVVYSAGNFYIVNKGKSTDVNVFGELEFTKFKRPGIPFVVKELYRNKQQLYLHLEDGIIQVIDYFDTHYGCNSITLQVATPLFSKEKYEQMQEEIRLGTIQDLIDFRFL